MVERKWGISVEVTERTVGALGELPSSMLIALYLSDSVMRCPVVVRAQEILGNLERTEFDREGRPRLAHSGDPAEPAPGRQLRLFSAPDEGVLDDLRKVDPDHLTPVQALALLAELKRRLGG
jgi:hypothetical protein